MIRIMKMKIATFSSLLCLFGTTMAGASECTGAGCDIQPIVYGTPEISAPTVLAAPIMPAPAAMAPMGTEYAAPVEYIYAGAVPMRSVKTLSIKPVPADTRPKLWDGTNGTYKTRGADKTVDWRDGVPIWDDSIVSYKDKDFSDWFLEPMPEIYLRPVDAPTAPVVVAPMAPVSVPAVSTESVDIMELYNQNMADAVATRQRVEELLAPRRPANNLWLDTGDKLANDAVECDTNETITETESVAIAAPAPKYTAQDMTEIVKLTFGNIDNCPFESETECEIWRRKPIVRETVSPRSPKINAINMGEFIQAARCNKTIRADDPAAAALLQRYKMLMKSANACCTDGMAYSLKQAGASDGLVYKFLADDANFYGLGARCLMMTDNDFDTKYPNTATAAVAADVRNGCLCRGRQWFSAMLAPFAEVYKIMPEFADQKFYYTYTDGLGREITVSVNNDVQNVLNQLALCP